MKFVNNRPLWLAALLSCPALSSAAESITGEPQLEEVIVTATRLPRSIDDIAGSISVIGEERMQRELADDLGDIVRFEPGISMDSASRGGNEGFSIRGIGGNRVLTVIDGVRSNDLYEAGPASYGKDLYEVDDLVAVEIIRGPASVQYGADAMGGAVILRTREPEAYLQGQQSRLDIRTSGSSADDAYKTGFSYAFRTGSMASVLQYTHREHAELDINGPGRLNPQTGHSDNWMLKSAWQPSDSHRLLLTLDSNQQQIDTRIDTDLSDSVQESVGEDDSGRLRASLSHTWQLDSVLADELRSQISWQRTDAEQVTRQRLNSYSFVSPQNPVSFRGTAATRYSDFQFDQETRTIESVFSRSFGDRIRHAMVYGLHLEQTETERPRQRCDTAIASGAVTCSIAGYPFAPPEQFPNKTFPDSKTTRSGVFWQDEIVLGDSRLTVIPGLRYDHYRMDPSPDALLDGSGYIEEYGGYPIVDVDEEQLSLTFGAIYEFSESLSAFAQYAEGYRPPNFDESNQAFVNLGHGYATVPNPQLGSESSKGTEVGLRAQLDTVSWSLALYNNRYNDFISSEMVGMEDGIMLFQDRNIGNVRIYGAEASGSWQLAANWQINGSLAWSRGEDRSADLPLDSVEPVTAVLGAAYTSDDERWGLQSLLTVVGEKRRVSSDTLARSDSYELVDLIGHYRFTPAATLRFGIFNVFDQDYAFWGSIRGLSATDNANLARAQAPGRNLRVGFNYQF